MALLKKSDLEYEYSWTAVPPDDPKATGEPDSTLLNRGEGYEVLYFINRIAAACGWKQKSTGLKMERLIKEHLPGDTRSHKNVLQWLDDNWKSFE